MKRLNAYFWVAFGLLLLAALANTAWAERPPPPPKPTPHHQAQGQLQGQAQGQIQGQLQAQQQHAAGGSSESYSEGSSATANGDQSVTFEDTLQRYNNPNIWLNIPNPTAPCMGSKGIGGSGGGLGLSLGGTVEDKECTARETARMFANMGQGQFALRILCQTKAVERAGLAAECPTDWQPPSPPMPPPPPPNCDEKLERCEQHAGKGGR